MALYGNGKRISGIRDFPAYTWAEYHALPVAKRPRVWNCTDMDYTEIPRESVSVTADGVKTTTTLLNELWAAADKTKISNDSFIEFDIGSNRIICRFVREESGAYSFSNITESTPTDTYANFFTLKQTGSARYIIQWSNSISHLDRTTSVMTSGWKVTLYY